MRVVVVGAGVLGLSCAVLLAEAGHEVEVRSDRQPLDTTSAVAAALWYPYRAEPLPLVSAWGDRTYDVLAGLAGAEPAAGVRMRAGTELLRQPAQLSPWADTLPDAERLADVPDGYAGGWTFTAPVVDMGTYLP